MAESGESKFTIFSPFFQRVGGDGSKTLILLLTNRYKANIRAILNKTTLFTILFNSLISGLIDYVAQEAVQLTGHTTYQATRASDSGKASGRGLCVYTNNRRCTHTKITNTQCSLDLKYLTVTCRPFYLPGELRGNDYYCNTLATC